MALVAEAAAVSHSRRENVVKFVLSSRPFVAAVLVGGCLLVSAAHAANPDPERFAKAINWFAAMDQKSATPRDPVLFVGSSSIVQWDTATAFDGLPVVNRGFGGAHISDVLYYFDRVVKPYEPQAIVFYCGGNDIADGKSPDQVLHDFAAFRQRVNASFQGCPVIFLSLKPSPARWEQWSRLKAVNARIKELAVTTPMLIYAETASVLLGANGKPDAALFQEDGLHLNSAGYAKWQAVLTPLLANYVNAAEKTESRSTRPPAPAAKRDERVRIGRMTEYNVDLRFLSYVPPGYKLDSDQRWPLVLFLHGSGERGTNIEKLALHGPPKLIKAGKQFPFIMIAPQCPGGRWFRVAELVALLDHVEAQYLVDPDRIYVTGLSMGGFGTFQLAAAIPHRLAAVAPICGGGAVQTASLFKNLPVWAFHGDADTAVPMQRSKEMVDAINAAGGHAKLTIYPGVGHDSWTRTYADPKFWEWLLKQKRD